MSYEASTHWTFSAIVLLGFVVGIVSSYPILSRTNDASLERRWETMFSRSILGISGANSELNWESDYLLGIKRVRRLYCNVGIGFHLQVLPDGRINGIHTENQYSLIEISAVERGVVSLYGVKSELFVAMNTKGRLYGTAVFHEECKFRESLLPNNYNAYESSAYSGSYIALSKHGRVKKGTVLRGFQIGSTLPIPSPLLNPTWGDPKRLVHLYTSSDKRSFHLAINRDGQVDRTPIQTPSSAMLLKSDGIGLVAIMGVKSERYLCMDANGKAFSSAVFNIEYCLFQHERLENGYDVYHSSKSNLVLNLGGRAHTYIPGGNLPPYSQFISLVNTVELEHFVRKRSTSIHVDPSDPFGMFTANSQPATGEDSVETQASREVPALSRERTRSTYHDEVDPDDPWRLLDHKTNSSPRYSVS
ncbi:UNVERIFIED_CONTAM: hypothetical protein FKN15_000298 [Acipenser sinensis]